MNKKIYKGYELFKMIANNELRVNCKIKDILTGKTAIWDEMNFRIDDNDGRYFTETYDDIEFITREFELLEDNTEEIEEESFEQLGYEVGKMSLALAKGLERAINELKKKGLENE